MAKQFEDGPILSVPSPKSGIERRLIKNDLDERIALGKEKVAVMPTNAELDRPTIGVLPTPTAFPELDEPAPEEADGDAEVTESTRARLIVHSGPPIRK